MADISKENLDGIIENIKRYHAASELRAEAKGFVEDLKNRKRRMASYKDNLGTGDVIVSEEYIALIEGFCNLLALTLSNAESEYKVFLTGQEKTESSEL